MDRKYTREDCLLLLNEKYKELRRQGADRYPQRTDFGEREVVAIKAHLGPWPRALEAAGIKEPREKKQEKKINKERGKQK